MYASVVVKVKGPLVATIVTIMSFMSCLVSVAESAAINIEPVSANPVFGVNHVNHNVMSELLLFDADLDSLLPPTFNTQSSQPAVDDFVYRSVELGGAIDLFYRYGFFSLSVRVVPRNDPGSWLVREPTTSVFEGQSVFQTKNLGPNSFARQPFEIYLCDDLSELEEAYFRAFKAEGVHQPHKVYTGSWRTPTAASYLGVDPKALEADNSFVLIKLAKNSWSVQVDPSQLQLSPQATRLAESIRPGDADSVMTFVQNYGTHYIRSVTVGDALYQVLVLTRAQMEQLQRDVAQVGNGGTRSLDRTEWGRLYEAHLAPWRVSATGAIKVASGDAGLQRFVDEELRLEGQFGTSYPSLVGGLLDNPSKVLSMEQLGRDSSAVVSVDLASIRSFVGRATSPQVLHFYDEIVDTQSALWGANLK